MVKLILMMYLILVNLILKKLNNLQDGWKKWEENIFQRQKNMASAVLVTKLEDHFIQKNFTRKIFTQKFSLKKMFTQKNITHKNFTQNFH